MKGKTGGIVSKQKRAQAKIGALNDRIRTLIELFHDVDRRTPGGVAATALSLQLSRLLVERATFEQSLLTPRAMPVIRAPGLM